MDRPDLFQLREIGSAVQCIPVHGRILHHRSKQHQGRRVRLSRISGRIEHAPEVERALHRDVVFGVVRGHDRSGQRSGEGRASPRRTGDKDVRRGRVHVVRPAVSDVPRRRIDRRRLRRLRRLRARWRAQLCEVRRAEGNRRDCDANQCDGDGDQAKRSDAHPVPPVAKPAKNAQSIRELLDGRRTSA